MEPNRNFNVWRTAILGIAAAIAMVFGLPATAQAQGPAQPPGYPSGPWQFECYHAYLDGFYLRAQCHTKTGQLGDDIYDLRDCPTYTLVNVDGKLACSSQKQVGVPGNSNVLPFGEWLWYCTDGYFDRNKIFHARCLNNFGNMRPEALQGQNCQGKPLVSYDNGRLLCDGRQNGNAFFVDTQIPGNWRVTCRDPFFDSNKNLYAFCRDNQGKFRPSRLSMPACQPGAPVSAPNGQLRC